MLAGEVFGHLGIHERLPSFATAERVAWGLVPSEAIAVRVVLGEGGAVEGAVLAPDFDGRAAFCVELPHDRWPSRLVVIDRAGTVIRDDDLLPSAESSGAFVGEGVEVRSVDRDGGPAVGSVVGEGAVGDVRWEYGVHQVGAELHTFWRSRSPTGGGSSSGSEPTPAVPASTLRVQGCGAVGSVWRFEALAGLGIDRGVVHLATGETIELPLLGRHLDLGFGYLSVSLPLTARAVVLDGVDADGNLIDRVWLTSHLSWMNTMLDRQAEDALLAAAPLSEAVLRRWSSVFPGIPPSSSVEVDVDDQQVRDRWPIRPLLIPPGNGRWTLGGHHHRFPINQVVGISLVWQAATVVLAQSIAWLTKAGTRDEANVHVRGRPGRLDVFTAGVNNIDEITLTWHEPGEGLEPFTGVWITIAGHPAQITVEEMTALAETLRVA
jgi:hypothetical protein